VVESIYDDELMGLMPEESTYKKPTKTKRMKHKKSIKVEDIILKA